VPLICWLLILAKDEMKKTNCDKGGLSIIRRYLTNHRKLCLYFLFHYSAEVLIYLALHSSKQCNGFLSAKNIL